MPRPQLLLLPPLLSSSSSSSSLTRRLLLLRTTRSSPASSILPRTCHPHRRAFSARTPSLLASPNQSASVLGGQDPQKSPPNAMVYPQTRSNSPTVGFSFDGGEEAVNALASPLHSPAEFDTSFDEAARQSLKIRGLIPPGVETFDLQKMRCLEQLRSKPTPIEKYNHLSHVRNTNVNLFYRLLIDNMKELTPFVYTPTVGEACQKWSHIYTQPEGLYLSAKDDIAEVLGNWPQKKVTMAVITDGSRILGLGDLGIGGMGISVGKLALYSGCAGVHPSTTLPIVVDFGTDNQSLIEDPLYLGARHPRLPESEQMAFMDRFMREFFKRWPYACVQFEDWKNPFWSLERYRHSYTCFNDDIQGTGAVILAGVMSAFKKSTIPLEKQKIVFMGAGSAAVGVAKQICQLFIRSGIEEEQAKRMIWLVDSRGLVTNDRGDKLAEHKLYFSRDDNDGQQFATLDEVLDFVKPTGLMGLCTIGGVFTESIIRKMAKFNEQVEGPIIFPLSNPSSKSECTFEQAYDYTDGRVIFASGSPFPTYKGVVPGQGNNVYVFPGLGLAVALCEATAVTEDMVYASAEGLAESLSEEEVAKKWIYPELARVREVSVVVARTVIRSAQRGGVDRNKYLRVLSDEELDQHIAERMYDPKELTTRANSRSTSRVASREPSPTRSLSSKLTASNL